MLAADPPAELGRLDSGGKSGPGRLVRSGRARTGGESVGRSVQCLLGNHGLASCELRCEAVVIQWRARTLKERMKPVIIKPCRVLPRH